MVFVDKSVKDRQESLNDLWKLSYIKGITKNVVSSILLNMDCLSIVTVNTIYTTLAYVGTIFMGNIIVLKQFSYDVSNIILIKSAAKLLKYF